MRTTHTKKALTGLAAVGALAGLVGLGGAAQASTTSTRDILVNDPRCRIPTPTDQRTHPRHRPSSSATLRAGRRARCHRRALGRAWWGWLDQCASSCYCTSDRNCAIAVSKAAFASLWSEQQTYLLTTAKVVPGIRATEVSTGTANH